MLVACGDSAKREETAPGPGTTVPTRAGSAVTSTPTLGSQSTTPLLQATPAPAVTRSTGSVAPGESVIVVRTGQPDVDVSLGKTKDDGFKKDGRTGANGEAVFDHLDPDTCMVTLGVNAGGTKCAVLDVVTTTSGARSTSDFTNVQITVGAGQVGLLLDGSWSSDDRRVKGGDTPIPRRRGRGR